MGGCMDGWTGAGEPGVRQGGAERVREPWGDVWTGRQTARVRMGGAGEREGRRWAGVQGGSP